MNCPVSPSFPLVVPSSFPMPDWAKDAPGFKDPVEKVPTGVFTRVLPLPLSKPRGLRESPVDFKTNARIKYYLRKDVIQVANDSIFGSKGRELTKENKAKQAKSTEYEMSEDEKIEILELMATDDDSKPVDKERSEKESRRRAKTAVLDIANMNEFTHMFTWTIDPALIDRTDSDVVYRHVRNFLSNMGRRKGFKYVAIPEYHKKRDGEDKPGIHIHGLCILGDVNTTPAINAKTGRHIYTKTGRMVLNMSDWKYGHSTVVPLDDNYDKAVSYCAKYITKSEEKIFGKWYLSSRFIEKKPDIVPIEPVSYEEFRDTYKLEKKIQFEVNIYYDIKMISEEIKHDDVLCNPRPKQSSATSDGGIRPGYGNNRENCA